MSHARVHAARITETSVWENLKVCVNPCYRQDFTDTL